MDIYDALARARAQGEPVVLVTVLDIEGEAPSHPGAKLVVGDDEVVAGTLGCGEFDTAGAKLASEALAADAPVRRRLTFDSHGHERALELFAEVQRPQPGVLVFGATPVGRAVADFAVRLGRRAIVAAPGGDAQTPAGVDVHADDPSRYLLAAPPGSDDAIVVSDHDAPWVEETLRIALASDAFFVGMLGSRGHAPEVVRRLRASGVPEENLARLRSPCGLDIGSRSAEEIALSIVAEVLAVERGTEGGRLGVDWSQTPT